jgi:hypothetical protein
LRPAACCCAEVSACCMTFSVSSGNIDIVPVVRCKKCKDAGANWQKDFCCKPFECGDTAGIPTFAVSKECPQWNTWQDKVVKQKDSDATCSEGVSTAYAYWTAHNIGTTWYLIALGCASACEAWCRGVPPDMDIPALGWLCFDQCMKLKGVAG